LGQKARDGERRERVPGLICRGKTESRRL
jgi:hypothetical protein